MFRLSKETESQQISEYSMNGLLFTMYGGSALLLVIYIHIHVYAYNKLYYTIWQSCNNDHVFYVLCVLYIMCSI